MAAERNFLMEDAYPKLRKYCKERFGLEFEVSIFSINFILKFIFYS